jgi:hypothetical protein
MKIEWTADQIAKRSTEEVQSLRKNADKLRRQEIVALCDAELTHRKPTPMKTLRTKRSDENHIGQYVSEFHFVCPKELGIKREDDGLIWTGTWVVSPAHAKTAEDCGSLVALHTSRAEPSYLQGVIKAWRKSRREPRYSDDQLVKTEFGIDFQFEPTDKSIPWVGDATGERGYAWAPIPPTKQT